MSFIIIRKSFFFRIGVVFSSSFAFLIDWFAILPINLYLVLKLSPITYVSFSSKEEMYSLTSSSKGHSGSR